MLVLIVLHGTDQTQAGFRKLITGEDTDTLTSTGMQKLGVSKNIANLADAGISILFSMGAGASTKLNKMPELGKKLDFILGKAGGNAHNIQRSQTMLRQLERIGLFDNSSTRKFLETYLTKVLNNAENIAEIQSSGRVVKESILMGPNGGVKVQSIWEKTKLITVKIFGSGD